MQLVEAAIAAVSAFGAAAGFREAEKVAFAKGEAAYDAAVADDTDGNRQEQLARFAVLGSQSAVNILGSRIFDYIGSMIVVFTIGSLIRETDFSWFRFPWHG